MGSLIYMKRSILKNQERNFLILKVCELFLKPMHMDNIRYLVNNKDNIDLTEKPFIVFDIESVESDKFIFPVVGLIIMELVMDKIRNLKGVKKRFIIDEGWKVLRGELQDFVEYLYRTFRKHEGSIILATQDIKGFRPG